MKIIVQRKKSEKSILSQASRHTVKQVSCEENNFALGSTGNEPASIGPEVADHIKYGSGSD